MKTTKLLDDMMLERLYALLDQPMLSFDCGQLCGHLNDGIPMCCDQNQTVPLLFRNEFDWHRKRHRFWKKMPLDDHHARQLASECHGSPDELAVCPGPARCDRTRRALICRLFPFEPHVDADGRVLGLTYDYKGGAKCPLTGVRENIYNRKYIRDAIECWQIILDLMPDEKTLYVTESKKLRRKFKKADHDIPLFT